MRQGLSTPRELLLAHLGLIRELVRFFAHRHQLHRDDLDDLEQFIRLRLVEDDFAILRKFEQRSSFRTYLTVVVQRLFHDYCNQAWGRWRASAVAQRHGRVAEELEELLYRLGLGFEEACQVLVARSGGAVDREVLLQLYAAIPQRLPRRVLQEAAIAESAEAIDPTPDPETSAVHRLTAAAVRVALAAAIRRLHARDRLLLRLRYVEELAVPQIARTLDVPPKPLYLQIKTLLRRLKKELQAAGVQHREVASLLAEPSLFESRGEPARENGAMRPSNLSETDADVPGS